MHIRQIALPISIALFCAGLFLYFGARPKQSAQDLGIDFTQPPKHPITSDMVAKANLMARKTAPAFHVADVKGNPLAISGSNLSRPQLVLFILDSCPCSIDAQPLFNSFAKHWAGKVDFIGVINADAKKGRGWASDYRAGFPVVPDPKLEIIHAYKAQQSVYSALVSKQGEIVKLWPGYSSDMMQEMNRLIAAEVGEPVRPFDTQYAPKDKTSGCYFGGNP
jgi:peroxiredoxin